MQRVAGPGRNHRTLPSALLVALTLACGGEDAADGADRTPRWTVEETTRIGSVDDPHTSFMDVADVLPADGQVFVLESGQPRVAVFGPEGEWLRDFAGPGDGPGELRRPSALGLTGDELWVRDPRGARLETYALDGEPRESFRFSLPGDSLAVTMAAHAVLADGRLLAGPGRRPITPVLRGQLRYADYARVDRAGEIPEPLYRAELAEGDAYAADVGGGRQIIGIHPIQHSPLVEPFPDGSGVVAVERLIAEGPEEHAFRLLVLDVDGTATTDRAVPYTPVSAEGWRERHIGRLAESARGSDVPQSVIDGLREDLPERAFYPPVSELVAGMDGTLWLRREPVDTLEATWEVYDREGALLATVGLPADLQLRHATREELWAVERDELDVPYVVGLRVGR